MSTEVKEVYPEVSPVPAYVSTPPPQSGMYNKASEGGFQQPMMDQYQNPHTGMGSPPPQQQFTHQQSFQQQPVHDFQQQQQQQGQTFQQQPAQNYQQQPQSPQPTQQNPPQMAQIGQQQSYNSGVNRPQYQTAVPLFNLGSSPAPVDCPSCGARSLTRTYFESGNTTNAWALGLFLTTCLCCIAYMINGTKDVIHKCGNCGIELAQWHRSGRTEVKINA